MKRKLPKFPQIRLTFSDCAWSAQCNYNFSGNKQVWFVLAITDAILPRRTQSPICIFRLIDWWYSDPLLATKFRVKIQFPNVIVKSFFLTEILSKLPKFPLKRLTLLDCAYLAQYNICGNKQVRFYRPFNDATIYLHL